MNGIGSILLNAEEVRRRSCLLWNGIPEAFYHWRPDARAMSLLETVRHVLEGEHLFHVIVLNRGDLGAYPSPWLNRPYTNVADELEFARAYRSRFLETIRRFTDEDLGRVEIVRSEKGQRRRLGDYLNRIIYHEAVHAGQLLGAFRTLQVARPMIWD